MRKTIDFLLGALIGLGAVAIVAVCVSIIIN
jgi:hypothetical protein